MSITGPGSITALNIAAVNAMSTQVDQLSTELATGHKAQTYSGLDSQAGVLLALNTQLSAINGYSDTANMVGTTLSLAQSILTQIGGAGSTITQALSQPGAFKLSLIHI